MCKEETDGYNFEGFPNEVERGRLGMRGPAAGSPMFAKVKIFMERMNQLEGKIQKLENIATEH